MTLPYVTLGRGRLSLTAPRLAIDSTTAPEPVLSPITVGFE